MPEDAHLRVDARLAGLPGENYRSTEIALKASISISRKHELQAIEYRDELSRRPGHGSMSIMLPGKGRAPASNPQYSQPDLRVFSYDAVISAARGQLEWLLKELQHDN